MADGDQGVVVGNTQYLYISLGVEVELRISSIFGALRSRLISS